LLRKVIQILTEEGFGVTNVDATVMAEQPKLKPHIDPMREQLAPVLGVGIDRVSIKAKTSEGLESVGRGEAMAAHAVVLIHSTGDVLVHRRDAEDAEMTQRVTRQGSQKL
jgi:2-C-methyl-D-erythritol 2,4-cyclodiphosphate synthase